MDQDGTARRSPAPLRAFRKAKTTVKGNSLIFAVFTVTVVPMAQFHLAAEDRTTEIVLRDVASQAGIRAQMVCGSPGKRWIFEANGSGAACFDYDNDGWLDFLIVNGSTLGRLKEIVSGKPVRTSTPALYLYRNLKDGKFEDVTVKSGLSNPFWGTGANAADYDNDGHTDVLITTIGVDLLYRNKGDGTFTRVSAKAGLSDKVAWHTGSTFGDYDLDGDLDLYVAGYVDIHSLDLSQPAPVCRYLDLPVFCGPRQLKGEADILYRNNGDGTFTDVTASAGVSDEKGHYGFTAVFDDLNDDGKPDIFVANDSSPNYLYLNRGDGHFEESALTSGVGFSANGRAQADMGAALGDYDNDGKIDVFTTTFSEDYFPLFRRNRSGFFDEISAAAGLGTTTLAYLGWGCGFTDLDNDGDKDLWTANGHIYPNIGKGSRAGYAQPVAIFENREGKFAPVEEPSVPVQSYRGGCSGDFNNDGKVDVLVLPVSGSPVLLRNRAETQHSWIGFKLKGATSNRDGIGARVRIEFCGGVQIGALRNGGSYLSRHDERVHFGLGSCGEVGRAVVTWPGGEVQTLEDVGINQYVTVEEP